jgi:hypothetical protein
VLLAVSACGGTLRPSATEPLSLGVEISAATVRAGVPATVTFRLRNNTPDVIRLSFSSSCQISPYIALHETNTIVFPEGGAWVCAAVLTELEVPPHGSVTRQIRIAIAGGRDAADAALRPGAYAAFARLEDAVYRLESPRASFRVQ